MAMRSLEHAGIRGHLTRAMTRGYATLPVPNGSHCNPCANTDNSAAGGGGRDPILPQNKAISRLIRTGRLQEARRLFDGLPRRNVVTWNSLISGYVQHRELSRARGLFDRMPERDVISWNTMLLGYTLSRDGGELKEGRRLFDSMPVRDSVSWNTMIRGYMRNGRVADAALLFDEMPEKNTISWNTMITGLFENGDAEKAVEMFETMPARDESSLSVVVSGLVQNQLLDSANSVLFKFRSIGFTEGFIDACNVLIAAYGRDGNVKEASHLFSLIPDRPCCDRDVGGKDSSKGRACKNIISWNSMMMCYIKAGDLCSARNLFDEMPERDHFSWNTMISGYVNAMEVEKAASLFQEMPSPNERTWNSMIQAYSQKGETEKARDYFDMMPLKNLVSWNTMIAGYEQNGDYEGAMKLFSQMLSAGQRLDRHTLSSVLGACAGLASLTLGTQIHQVITKTFVGDIPVNNALTTMYARCGNLVNARSIFDGMKLCKDFISWNAMICAYSQHGLTEETFTLFERMKKENVRPTNITFIAVLSACCRAGLVAKGLRQLESMVHEFGIMPSVEHYALLVNLIGHHGQLKDAMKVIDQMLVPPDKSLWGALLDACRRHHNCELARIAADALVEVDPDSAGPYVLLYNMYADLGRWEDAISVREMLDKHGIRKQPGYSWIELQKNLHIFVAADKSHPFTSEIYALIEAYERIIRDEHFMSTSTLPYIEI